MKTATLTETKNRLGALIARVRNGETILILDRGHPVARLEPVQPSEQSVTVSRAPALERAGILKRGRKRPDVLLRRGPPAAARGASILRALLQDRETDR